MACPKMEKASYLRILSKCWEDFIGDICRLRIKERLAFSTLCNSGLFPPFTIYVHNFCK